MQPFAYTAQANRPCTRASDLAHFAACAATVTVAVTIPQDVNQLRNTAVAASSEIQGREGVGRPVSLSSP